MSVLKAGNIKFIPSLPEYKQEVIDGMGFGLVNKCAMYWNNKQDMVWPEKQFWFELMRSSELKDTKWNSFFNPSFYKEMPTLTAWIGGQDAVEMEARTDEDIVAMIMENLVSMFPNIRRPDKVMITRWGREEHTLGTYSYKKVNRSWKSDAEKLGRGVGRLWFAGEATSSRWSQTAAGAWDSGDETAMEIAQTLGGSIADCATSDYPRVMHPRKTWKFLQDAYAKSQGTVYSHVDPHHGFLIPFEIKDDGPRGRSVYTTEAIPKGTNLYNSRNIARFRKESDLTKFLRFLPHDLKCDVLLWAWGTSSGASLRLDEGSFIHRERKSELITHRNNKALRDILPGEELLEDYGAFVHTDGGWFGELRARSWGDLKSTEKGGTELARVLWGTSITGVSPLR